MRIEALVTDWNLGWRKLSYCPRRDGGDSTAKEATGKLGLYSDGAFSHRIVMMRRRTETRKNDERKLAPFFVW